MRIDIVAYQPHWVEQFNAIEAKLRESLGGLARRIDHIGSTSVPGLDAKDVIDIQVLVQTLDLNTDEVNAFAAAGFPLVEGLRYDHIPNAADVDPAGYAKRFAMVYADDVRAHIHVRLAGTSNARYALLFRDYLRANLMAADTYAAVKRELARLHPEDYDAYYAVKDPVCDLIMQAAENWAVIVAWTLDDSDEER